jgi:hypothetical protein
MIFRAFFRALAPVFLGILAVAPPRAGASTPPAAAGLSSAPEEDDVVEVGGGVRELPRLDFLPENAAAEPVARQLARLVPYTGVFLGQVLPVGAAATGAVRVAVRPGGAGQVTEVESTSPRGERRRRVIESEGPPGPLDSARLVDALLADLTGERSHLSGAIVVADATRPGTRRIRVMLPSGVPLREVSPPGILARGPDISPGGVVHFAAARPGQPLRLFREGEQRPLDLPEEGDAQSVAFAADGQAAVVLGREGETTLWRGLLGGTMRRVRNDGGVSLSPTFGPGGLLAFAHGPPEGPLRIWVEDRPISPAGVWAAAPSFCGRGGASSPAGKPRLAYMVRRGASWEVVLHDLPTGATRNLGPGMYPVCSPDGRAVLVSRPGPSATQGALWLVGAAGVGAHAVPGGTVTGGRWTPGPPLPPEG